jgi:hypothetical protein
MHHRKFSTFRLGLTLVACLLLTAAPQCSRSEAIGEGSVEEAAASIDKEGNGDWQESLREDKSPLSRQAAGSESEPSHILESTGQSVESRMEGEETASQDNSKDTTLADDVEASDAMDVAKTDEADQDTDPNADDFADFVRNKKLSAKLRHQKGREKEKDVVKKEMLKQRARAAAQSVADSVEEEHGKEAQPRAEDVVVVDSPQQQWKSSDKQGAESADGRKDMTDDEHLRRKTQALVCAAAGHWCMCAFVFFLLCVRVCVSVCVCLCVCV